MRDGNRKNKKLRKNKKPRFELTYEGWKPDPDLAAKDGLLSFELTYEGWKLLQVKRKRFTD